MRRSWSDHYIRISLMPHQCYQIAQQQQTSLHFTSKVYIVSLIDTPTQMGDKRNWIFLIAPWRVLCSVHNDDSNRKVVTVGTPAPSKVHVISTCNIARKRLGVAIVINVGTGNIHKIAKKLSTSESALRTIYEMLLMRKGCNFQVCLCSK